MTDHVAVLRRMRQSRFAWTAGEKGIAALDHAIAAIEERDKLVARLGELEARWRADVFPDSRERAVYEDCADDLARVVKETSDE